jgi:hypothetical protein
MGLGFFNSKWTGPKEFEFHLEFPPPQNDFFAFAKKVRNVFFELFLPLKLIFYARKSLENIFKTFYTWKKRSLWGKRIFPLFCMERINRFVIIIIIVIILTKFIVYLL